MNIPSLDARLSAVVDLVRPGSVAADIGTDHGYAAVWLALQGRIIKGYACDVNPGPLERARATVRAFGAEDKVALCLSDGLAGLNPWEIDDIIIAGMGGDLIARILSQPGWWGSGEKHLILQPMTKAENLRLFLAGKGFRIEKEQAVKADRHLYTVLSAYDGGERWEPDDLFRWIGGVKPDTEAGRAYLEKRKGTAEKIAHGLFAAGRDGEGSRMAGLAARIDTILK